MSEQITTAEELDALPTHSIVAYIGTSDVPAVKAHDGVWYVAGHAGEYESRHLVRGPAGHKGALTVLYRPDTPAPSDGERDATPDEAHDIGYTKGHIDGYRAALRHAMDKREVTVSRAQAEKAPRTVPAVA